MISKNAVLKNNASKPVVIALLALAMSFISLAALAVDNDSSQVSQATSKFYNDYLQRINNLNPDSPELIPYLSGRNDVDPAYLERLNNLITEALKEDETGLGYDPILMGQQVPEKMTFDGPIINGAIAEVIAHKIWGDGTSSPLCITLNKQDGAWRISDVIDMEYEGLRRDCGGMKVD